MKKIFTFLAASIIVANLSAQENNFLPKHLGQRNNETEQHFSKKRQEMFNRTINEIKQKLDSTYSYNTEMAIDRKSYYTYNNSNKVQSSVSYSWNTPLNSWYESDRSTFDDNGNRLSSIYLEINSETGDTSYCEKSVYTFVGNNKTMRISYTINNGDWVNNSKSEYTYDANNNRTSYIRYSWQDDTWKNSYKQEYTYNANNNKTLDISYYWQDNAWIGSYKTEYTYDANNNRTLNINYSWQNNEWTNADKSEYTYDTNNNQTLYFYYSWQDNTWINNSKTESTYNANNNQTSSISFNWQDDAWINSSKNEYIYDTNNNQTSRIRSNWEDNAWVNSSKTETVYDLAYLSSEVTTPYGNLEEYGIHNKFLSFTNYNWNNNTWEFDDKDEYYYSTATAIEELSQEQLNIYPNPTRGIINISIPKLEKVEVYNLSGVLVQSTNKSILDLSKQEKGIYIVKAISNKGVVSKRIILE